MPRLITNINKAQGEKLFKRKATPESNMSLRTFLKRKTKGMFGKSCPK